MRYIKFFESCCAFRMVQVPEHVQLPQLLLPASASSLITASGKASFHNRMTTTHASMSETMRSTDVMNDDMLSS